MRKHDQIEEELQKLPSAEMNHERKMNNLREIKSTRRKRKKDYILYPITLAVFLAVIGLGYMLMMPTEPVSVSEKTEKSSFQKYFEEVEPIYSSSHISADIPEKYQKSVAVSYIYNAATFYTLEGEEIHPITANQEIDSYFEYSEEEIATFENDTIMLDYKGTIIYMRSASQIINDKDITKKLESLIQEVERLNRHETIQYNYDIYKDVSIELGNIAKEINQVTSDVHVYVGESSEWNARLQPLLGEDYFLYLSKENRDGKMRVKVSSPDHEFEEHLEFDYSIGFWFGTSLPKEMENAEEIELTITEDGEKHTVVLERKELTKLYP